MFLEDQTKAVTTTTTHQQPAEEEKTSSSSVAALQLNDRDINEFFNPRVSDLTLEERVKLVLSVGEEVI